MDNKNHNFFVSMGCAVKGIVYALKVEANLRRQVIMFAMVLILAWYLQISTMRIIVILVVSMAVIVVELLNSALEALADGVHPEYNSGIQKAKDISAGAVLIISMSAFVVGLFILGAPLLKFLTSF